MKNYKALMLFGAFLFFTQIGFAQSDECKQKMNSMMQEFQKEISSNPDMTREKADALTEDFVASAKKKFPECFPDDFEDQRAAQKQEAEIAVRKKQEQQREKAQQEEKKRLELEKVEIQKTTIKKPKELSRLEKKRKATNKSSDPYKAFRKECMRDEQDLIVELRERSLKFLEEAKNPAAEKEVRKAFQEAKSRILHDCAIMKMEELKKSKK